MINLADVVVGLAWGDEAKGKITAQLAATRHPTDGGQFMIMLLVGRAGITQVILFGLTEKSLRHT